MEYRPYRAPRKHGPRISAIGVGCMIAGIIVTLISYGILG